MIRDKPNINLSKETEMRDYCMIEKSQDAIQKTAAYSLKPPVKDENKEVERLKRLKLVQMNKKKDDEILDLVRQEIKNEVQKAHH